MNEREKAVKVTRGAIGKVVASVVLALGLLWLLFRGISWEEIRVAALNVPVWALAAAFFFYTVMNLMRATRFQVVFPEVSFGRLVGVSLVHNFFNMVIPFRIGELSFPLLLRKHAAFSKTVTALVVVRLLDLIMITLIFLAAVVLVAVEGRVFVRYGVAVGGILGGAVLALWLLRKVPSRFFPKRLRGMIEELRAYSARRLAGLFGHTAGIWISSLGFYFVLAGSLGIGTVSYIALCIPITFVRLTNVLPISGFAGFGTTEGAWVLGMLAIGIDAETALVSGLILHVLRLAYTVVLGGLGGLLLR